VNERVYKVFRVLGWHTPYGAFSERVHDLRSAFGSSSCHAKVIRGWRYAGRRAATQNSALRRVSIDLPHVRIGEFLSPIDVLNHRFTHPAPTS
jgi:hypothetical protein